MHCWRLAAGCSRMIPAPVTHLFSTCSLSPSEQLAQNCSPGRGSAPREGDVLQVSSTLNLELSHGHVGRTPMVKASQRSGGGEGNTFHLLLGRATKPHCKGQGFTQLIYHLSQLQHFLPSHIEVWSHLCPLRRIIF